MNLLDIINEYSVDVLNSITKYPSIKTFHEINRGTLRESTNFNLDEIKTTVLFASEKIDGTNTRIIVMNGDYIVGSREELLYRKGDVFGNPSQGIVKIAKPFAEHIAKTLSCDNKLYVFYGETYGSNINGAKNYTNNGSSCLRFFDIAVFTKCFEKYVDVKSLNAISSWRENGNQPYLNLMEFGEVMERAGIGGYSVPYLFSLVGSAIPSNLRETYEWLKESIPHTKAIIGSEYHGNGLAEGMVIRTPDRSIIFKIRFEDYEKTLNVKRKR